MVAGRHDEVDRASTLMFFDDPGHGCDWFVRNTPFPAVNPSLAFAEEFELPPGDTLRRRYRIVADEAWDRERLDAYAKEHPWSARWPRPGGPASGWTVSATATSAT